MNQVSLICSLNNHGNYYKPMKIAKETSAATLSQKNTKDKNYWWALKSHCANAED